MAFTEFCCRSGGSNLNAGTRTGNSTVPGTAADFTYANGTWDNATKIWTKLVGTIDGSIAVGDYVSLAADATTTLASLVGRVTAVTTTTITVPAAGSSGSYAGTVLTTLRVGGAWKGPNAAELFPFGFLTQALANASGLLPRINLMNNAEYSVTVGITHSNTLTAICGFASAYGDEGAAILSSSSAGTTGFTFSAAAMFIGWLTFKSTASTGSTNGVGLAVKTTLFSIAVLNFRGIGFSISGTYAHLIECQADNCGIANGGTTAGFSATSAQVHLVRCVATNNVGSNNVGFRCSNGAILVDCIAAKNQVGAIFSGNGTGFCFGCDFYDNTSHGANYASSATVVNFESCNFVKNGGYGISSSFADNASIGYIGHCGFGTGTMANTSGNLQNMSSVYQFGVVNYAANSTPWNDPTNGDFRVALAAAKNAGRGSFTQRVSGYNGTIAYNDIGAARHIDPSGGGGGFLAKGFMARVGSNY